MNRCQYWRAKNSDDEPFFTRNMFIIIYIIIYKILIRKFRVFSCFQNDNINFFFQLEYWNFNPIDVINKSSFFFINLLFLFWSKNKNKKSRTIHIFFNFNLKDVIELKNKIDLLSTKLYSNICFGFFFFDFSSRKYFHTLFCDLFSSFFSVVHDWLVFNFFYVDDQNDNKKQYQHKPETNSIIIIGKNIFFATKTKKKFNFDFVIDFFLVSTIGLSFNAHIIHPNYLVSNWLKQC